MGSAGKQVAVKVSRKMHDVLVDGAKRTNMSITEFTDLVLRSKVETELPLAVNAAELRQVDRKSKTAKNDLKATLAQARVIFEDRLPATMRETLGLMRQLAARRRK